ncbi:unnamed protein product [Ceutorhynchus assimilis]|uniref:BTB domain-containing protein n=1 Tax=Ceutorhynchus assimilis TaxID=467358 RepID=A0A9N9MR26_9CUCU|nr:unnamed protein product [Ceutorhynchus assimilis]
MWTAFTQTHLTSLKERKTDCIFLINKKTFEAHKDILANISPVFEKMFFGNLASKKILIEDIQPDDFKQMLDYIYLETIQFNSIENAWSIVYIAKKYLLYDLLHLCTLYVLEHLTIDTLVLSYEYSELYNLKYLREKCFSDIIEAVNSVLVADYHMKATTLKAILRYPKLLITNLDLLCKIIDWAIDECHYENISTEPESIVDILKEHDILRYINRCSLISNCEYCLRPIIICNCVGELVQQTVKYLSDQVINWEEETSVENFKLSWPDICKTRFKFKIAKRIDLRWRDEFVSTITVTKKIIISGLLLSSESSRIYPKATYDGHIRVKFCDRISGSIIATPTFWNYNSEYDFQVYVPLRFPVRLDPDKVYDIKLAYRNLNLDRKASVLKLYMSDYLEDKKRDLGVWFHEYDGTLIRGISYYPAW